MTVDTLTRSTECLGVHVQDDHGVCIEIAGQWHWISLSVAEELLETLRMVLAVKQPPPEILKEQINA